MNKRGLWVGHTGAEAPPRRKVEQALRVILDFREEVAQINPARLQQIKATFRFLAGTWVGASFVIRLTTSYGALEGAEVEVSLDDLGKPAKCVGSLGKELLQMYWMEQAREEGYRSDLDLITELPGIMARFRD